MKPREIDKAIVDSGKTPEEYLNGLLEQYGTIAHMSREAHISRQAFYDQCDKHNVTIQRKRKPVKK